MKRAGRLMVACGMVLGLACPAAPVQAAAACTLCIMEVQTIGAAGPDAEGQDVVIITNRGTANITSVQLRYVAATGVPSEASYLNIGTVNAGAARAFVAPSLATSNPLAESLKDMRLASAGGALIIGRSTSSVIYDSLGWGSAKTGYEGAPLGTNVMGTSMVRATVNGQLVDSDQNAVDFTVVTGTCNGVEFSEVQPFVTDDTGAAIDAWVELQGVADPTGDCMLVSAVGESYHLDRDGLPAAGALAVIAGAVDVRGQDMPLHVGEVSGQVWLANMSAYAGSGTLIYTPITGISYSALARGQTMANIDGLWRRTYQPTPGVANVYLAATPQAEVVSSACETVLITEVMPNPLGEDTGKEWIELHNSGVDMAPIGTCQIVVNGEAYGFLDDEVLMPGEYREFAVFYNADLEPRSLSLRNGEDNIIAWQRALPDVPVQVLQQLSYGDSPEAQSWSRYDVGWRWDDTPTPGADNLTLPDLSGGVPVEPAVPIVTDDTPAGGTSTEPGVPQRADIPVVITELLPNPAAPLSDDADEFVELLNNGDAAVPLRGYKLQVGSSYNYTYTFSDEVIPAHGYLVVTSGASTVSLSNTSGRARLTTASGSVVYETEAYGSAAAGTAWALVDGAWQWTFTPTPALVNVLTVAAAKTVKTSAAKSTVAKKPAKTGATKSATTTKSAKDKQTGAAAKTGSSTAAGPAAAPPLHIAVLAVVGTLAVLYAAYEYRHDIANRIHQLRNYRSNRRLHRQEA